MFYKIIYTVSLLGLPLATENENAVAGDITNFQANNVVMGEADSMEIDQILSHHVEPNQTSLDLMEVDEIFTSKAGKVKRTKSRQTPYQRPLAQKIQKDPQAFVRLIEQFQQLSINPKPEGTQKITGKIKRREFRPEPHPKRICIGKMNKENEEN